MRHIGELTVEILVGVLTLLIYTMKVFANWLGVLALISIVYCAIWLRMMSPEEASHVADQVKLAALVLGGVLGIVGIVVIPRDRSNRISTSGWTLIAGAIFAGGLAYFAYSLDGIVSNYESTRISELTGEFDVHLEDDPSKNLADLTKLNKVTLFLKQHPSDGIDADYRRPSIAVVMYVSSATNSGVRNGTSKGYCHLTTSGYSVLGVPFLSERDFADHDLYIAIPDVKDKSMDYVSCKLYSEGRELSFISRNLEGPDTEYSDALPDVAWFTNWTTAIWTDGSDNTLKK